jgi:hypothetical protein
MWKLGGGVPSYSSDRKYTKISIKLNSIQIHQIPRHQCHISNITIDSPSNRPGLINSNGTIGIGGISSPNRVYR